MKNCRDCKSWQITPEDVSIGTCRKKAPGSYQYFVQVATQNGNQLIPRVTAFPLICGDEWCDEFEPKIEVGNVQ